MAYIVGGGGIKKNWLGTFYGYILTILIFFRGSVFDRRGLANDSED